ncbi:MAG TPA: toll/interleukin-1 receptor domain-containing protein [Bryobacteraceae bacterium]|jgi:hypothetical protein
MASIFISYRREDSAPYARLLAEGLKAHFGGKHRVFMDLDTLLPGDKFAEAIERTVASCDVLIAVIGKQWLARLAERGQGGQGSTGGPRDWVRLEIETALKRDVRVIPALVGGARMPEAKELPEALAALASRQALPFYDDVFQESMDGLTESLEKVFGGRRPRWKSWAVGGAAAAVLAIGLMAARPVFRRTPGASRPEAGKVVENAPTVGLAAKGTLANTGPAAGPLEDLDKAGGKGAEKAAAVAKGASASGQVGADTPANAFSSTLLRYIDAAPSGFVALGAKDQIGGWAPSIRFPNAVSCRGRGPSQDAHIECVLARERDEAEADETFLEVVNAVQAALPGWRNSQMNLAQWAFFNGRTNDESTISLGVGFVRSDTEYEVTLSVYRLRQP